MPWLRIGTECGDQHVMPEDESHDISLECRCDPVVRDVINGSMLVVHNSFDGREAVEWANEIILVTVGED